MAPRTGQIALATTTFLVGGCQLDPSGMMQASPEGGFASASTDAAFDSPASHDTGAGKETGHETDDDSASGDDADAAMQDAPDSDGPVTSCDQDNDGFLAVGVCGGIDCCDTDPSAHPGQQSFFTFATACGGYDYNCDGDEEPLYAVVSCSGTGGNCVGQGIQAPGTCGATLPDQTCEWNPP